MWRAHCIYVGRKAWAGAFFGTNGYRKDFFVLVQAPFLALSVVVVIKVLTDGRALTIKYSLISSHGQVMNQIKIDKHLLAQASHAGSQHK